MSIKNQKQIVNKEKALKEIGNIILQHPAGVTVKDICAVLNATPLEASSRTVSNHLYELINRGLITRRKIRENDRSYYYFWSEKTEEQNPDPGPEAFGGEIKPEEEEVINCGKFCNQGDVVYCSSRSGDGAFFRYLVLAPWEYKATVLGIFPEGHPKLDLNDPNYIFIGRDPEKDIALYADVTNLCSRGYKCFGERLMHIDKDCLDDVKSRLTRTLRITAARSNADEKLAQAEQYVKKLRHQIEDLKDELDLSKKELGIQCTHYEEEIKDQKETISLQDIMIDDLKAAVDTGEKELKGANEDIAVLSMDNSKKAEELKQLKDKLKTAASGHNERLEVEVELLRRQCATYEAIIFALAGGN